MTGLTLLAFLVNDFTHEGKHEYAEVVAKATAYLMKAQDKEGCVGDRASKGWVYNHAMGALALVESFGLTRDDRVLKAARKAVAFSALARNPYYVWRYGVKPGDNDTSVTHWMLLGLHSARATNEALAEEGQPAVFEVDTQAFQGAISWLDKVTDDATGRVGYIQRGTGPARAQEALDRHPGEHSEAMTAAGINMRLVAGQGPDHPSIRRGAELLRALPPQWTETRRQSHVDLYYWFVGALAAQQIGGRVWQAWRPALLDAVAGTPRTEGDVCAEKGSWDPAGPWGRDGGRVYSTALMVQTLTVLKAGLTD